MADDKRYRHARCRNTGSRRATDLHLMGTIAFNEMGLDFRMRFAADTTGQRWVLRIPRRDGLMDQIEREASILKFVKYRLSVQVPAWRVTTPALIAYPMLTDPMALDFDAKTYAVGWNIDQHAESWTSSPPVMRRGLFSGSLKLKSSGGGLNQKGG